MRAFIKHTGLVAPLPMMNVDTDMIIPKQFLKTIKRSGLGSALFHELRQDVNGNIIPDFVLNKPAFAKSSILIAGENFGCGSSREHAPWALADYGFQVIIAPSFADIFFNNCFKNGILPIVLEKSVVDDLMQQALNQPGTAFTVDLEQQIIMDSSQKKLPFDVDPFRKDCLLNGLDDIGLTLKHEEKISTFEAKQQQTQPWLWQAS